MTRAIALLVIVCAAVNLPSLFPGFIQDDHPIVERNPAVNDPARLPELVTQGYWSVEKNFVNNLYRPVTLLSFALNRAVTGSGASGYRAVNLALHVLVTLLVYVVGRRLTGRLVAGAGVVVRPPAGSPPESWIDAPILAALLFAVHPVHTEVLGMIVGRAELLAAAGALGSVALFLAAREAAGSGRGDPGRVRTLEGLAIAAFLLGALSKENAIVAPALILAADLLVLGRRPAWGFHLVGAIAAGSFLGIRALVIGGINPAGGTHFLDNPMVAATFLEGRLTALAAIPRYLEVLIVPWRLSIDYSYDALPIARSLADPRVLAGVLTIGGSAWAVWRFRRAAPGLVYAVAWIGLAFAPVANLVFPIGTIMAERLIYLPSVGFCWAVALGFDRLTRRAHAPAPGDAGVRPTAGVPSVPGAPLTTVLLVAILIGFGIRSEVRYLDWRDDYSIFASAVHVVPRSAKAHFNHGTHCEERGELPAARRAYEQAIAIWPEFSDGHYNLAGVFAKQRDSTAAVAHYREALRLQPFNVRYLVNLAVAVAAQGDPAGARDLARRALEIDRTSDEAWTALGSAELALGDAAAAVTAYGEAAQLDPGRPILLFNLALAQERNSDIEGAIATYRRGLAAEPANTEMARGLAMALLSGGDAGEARQILEMLVHQAPAHPIYRYQLGQALEALGDVGAAIAAYREAARLAPGVPVPHRALGLILLRQGDREGAREALERAAAVDPEAWASDAEGRRALDGLRAGRKSPSAGP